MPLAKQPTWQPLIPYFVPETLAVYGIQVNGDWFYIGRTVNLRKAFKTVRPLQIGKSLSAHDVSFWFIRARRSGEATRLKRSLIEKHRPICNEFTAMGTPDYSLADRTMPLVRNRVTSHGPFCQLIEPATQQPVTPYGVVMVG